MSGAVPALCQVDWQAWATFGAGFAGAGAILCAACIAKQTVEGYRSKLRTEAAESVRQNLLYLAYGIRHQFNCIFIYYLKFSEKNEKHSETQRKLTFKITETIFRAHSDTIPSGCVYFGDQVWTVFDDLASEAQKVRTACEDEERVSAIEGPTMERIAELIETLQMLEPIDRKP